MRKIFILIVLFTYSCGYQPIYLNKNVENYEFSKIYLEGNKEINKKIIDSVLIKENKSDKNLNELLLKSSLTTIETSKDQKGKVLTYRSIVNIDLTIKKNEKIIKNKFFTKDVSYNNKENKFELVEYQNQLIINLINRSIEEIVLYLNLDDN